MNNNMLANRAFEVWLLVNHTGRRLRKSRCKGRSKKKIGKIEMLGVNQNK